MIAITGAIGLRSDNLKEHLEWYLKGHGVEESARPNIIAWLLEDDRGRPLNGTLKWRRTSSVPVVMNALSFSP